jgi:DNA-binding PadR family transcriptional regulator
MSTPRRLGRFAEPGMWVLVALHSGPRELPTLLDDVRSLDGPMGHGTLLGAVARLERLELVESAAKGSQALAYRLTQRGLTAAGSVAALRNEAHA